MITQVKKTNVKKSVAKSNAKPTKQQIEPKKISKTGLAFREAIKNPLVKIVDMRAVLR